MITIRATGTCVHNYDFEFDIDNKELTDDEAFRLAFEYFYENFPNEIDTNGFDVESIKVIYPDEEEE
jgi:hypothetical protein